MREDDSKAFNYFQADDWVYFCVKKALKLPRTMIYLVSRDVYDGSETFSEGGGVMRINTKILQKGVAFFVRIGNNSANVSFWHVCHGFD